MTKNLFLRDRKGSKHYLVVLEASNTLVISSDDFKKFLEYTQNQITYLDL